jgi:hypothetical protein
VVGRFRLGPFKVKGRFGYYTWTGVSRSNRCKWTIMVMVPTIGIPRCRDISIDGLQTEDYSFTIFDYIGLDRFYYARVCSI